MKNKLKKIFCVLLCGLVFLLAACGGDGGAGDGSGGKESPEQPGSPEKETDSSERESESSGEEMSDDKGSAGEDGVVHIKTPEDLVEFAERVNGGESALSAVLDADIDLSGVCSASAGSWTPIDKFQGEFDGQGHVVSNLYCVQAEKAGFFGEVGGTVKNLQLKDVAIESTEKFAGGVSCSILGGRVENCSVSGSVRAYDYAGGIVAYMFSDSSVVGCVNEAEIFGGYHNMEKNRLSGAAAGIAAYPRDTVNIRIAECVNRGAVTGNGYATGGIAGSCGKGGILIEGCTNEGSVQGRTGVTELGLWGESESFTGGIAGYGGKATTIKNCINKGSVSGTGYVAGVVVELGEYVINCANHGDLSGTEAGDVYGITRDAINGLLNCYSKGNITCDGHAVAIGNTASAVAVNLYNYGTVTCTADSGVLTDGFPWSIGGGSAARGLKNSYSKEGCIVVPDSFQDTNPSSIQTGCATPAASFMDGSILAALNEAVADINGEVALDYSGLEDSIKELKESEHFELSTWKAGADGLPCFDWE